MGSHRTVRHCRGGGAAERSSDLPHEHVCVRPAGRLRGSTSRSGSGNDRRRGRAHRRFARASFEVVRLDVPRRYCGRPGRFRRMDSRKPQRKLWPDPCCRCSCSGHRRRRGYWAGGDYRGSQTKRCTRNDAFRARSSTRCAPLIHTGLGRLGVRVRACLPVACVVLFRSSFGRAASLSPLSRATKPRRRARQRE